MEHEHNREPETEDRSESGGYGRGETGYEEPGLGQGGDADSRERGGFDDPEEAGYGDAGEGDDSSASDY